MCAEDVRKAAALLSEKDSLNNEISDLERRWIGTYKIGDKDVRVFLTYEDRSPYRLDRYNSFYEFTDRTLLLDLMRFIQQRMRDRIIEIDSEIDKLGIDNSC